MNNVSVSSSTNCVGDGEWTVEVCVCFVSMMVVLVVVAEVVVVVLVVVVEERDGAKGLPAGGN